MVLQPATDDGDIVLFQNRLIRWRFFLQSGTVLDDDGSLSDDWIFAGDDPSGQPENVHFAPGYLVPGVIWQALYPYQRTSVNWLWELHQQKAGCIIGERGEEGRREGWVYNR